MSCRRNGRRTVQPHDHGRRVVLGGNPCSFHGPRPDAQRRPRGNRSGLEGDGRKLQLGSSSVQHENRRLQALPDLSRETRVPRELPGIPCSLKWRRRRRATASGRRVCQSEQHAPCPASRVRRQSRSTTLRRELLIFKPPLYSMKPSFRNLFMKKFTRERVVPIISASVSCETLGSLRWSASGSP